MSDELPPPPPGITLMSPQEFLDRKIEERPAAIEHQKRQRHTLYGVIPPRPQDARRDLRSLWSSAAVYSCADGTLRIEPTWRKRFRRPGVLTRMHSAYLVRAVLTLPKKRIRSSGAWGKPMKPRWMPFNPESRDLPPERRYVLLLTAEQPDKGLPSSCAVGYLRHWSSGPFFVIPGIGGQVTHWADCLGDDFRTPVLVDQYSQKWQFTNGKWGQE